MSQKESSGRIRVTLIRSVAGRLPNHRDCVRGLGLRRMHHSVELEATPAIMGMVNKVAFMLKIEHI